MDCLSFEILLWWYVLAQVSKISHIVNKKLCCIVLYTVLISNLVK